MKWIPIPRLALVAALVVAGVIGTASFGVASAKACGLFSNCTVTVHVTGAGQANSSNAIGDHFCVTDLTTPTGVEGKTCTYQFGWGWVAKMNVAWPGVDGWQFKQWSGSGFSKPVHCDGENNTTNTYTGPFCQFWIWDNLEIRAEFVDTQAPDTTVTGPTGYFQPTTSATFTFTSNDHVPSTFKCSLDDAPYTACTSPITLSGLSQSSHAFRVRALDPSGNGDPTPALAQWSVDSVAPQNPTLTPDHNPAYWSTNPTVNVAFSNAQDGTSGIDGYSYTWDQTQGTVPDTTKDAEETATGATSVVLADGRWYFHLRTVDNAGNWSNTTTVGPFKIDRTPPSGIAVIKVPSISTTTAVTVRWTATDAASGVASYDVRYRAASTGGTFGSYFGWKIHTFNVSAVLTAVPGTTYCLSTRAWDVAGNVSGWSAERCTTVPLDDAALTATGAWTRATETGYYLGTVSRSTSTGAKLTSPTLSARRLVVLVTKCPTCGTIDVYWNGSLVVTTQLTASTTLKRQLVTLPLLSQMQSGVLKINVRSSERPVEIDGLAASPV